MAAMAFGNASGGKGAPIQGAYNPDGKGKGGKGIDGRTGRERMKDGEPCYIGKIKCFVTERQRGFIVCDEIYNMCGEDVYVHENVLQAAMAGPGDTVAFFVHWSSTSGKPQAAAPMIRLAAADGYALKGLFKPGPSHGFLQCESTKQFFGRDIYVNKDTAAIFVEGQTYAFNAYTNKDKMPNCDGKEGGADMCPEDWEPIAGNISFTRTDDTVVSKGKDKDGKGKDKGKGMDGKGKGSKEMQLWDMFQEMMGMGGGSNDWSGGKGDWSDGAKGGGKTLLKMKMCQHFQNGHCQRAERCTYAHSEEEVGTPQPTPAPKGQKGDWSGGGKGDWSDGGKGCSKGGMGSWDDGKGMGKDSGKDKGAPRPTGETFIGVIKTFNPVTNYGFIACEESEEAYAVSEIYFHGMFLGSSGLSAGDLVEFDVGLNMKQKPQACAMRAMSDPACKRQRLM